VVEEPNSTPGAIRLEGVLVQMFARSELITSNALHHRTNVRNSWSVGGPNGERGKEAGDLTRTSALLEPRRVVLLAAVLHCGGRNCIESCSVDDW